MEIKVPEHITDKEEIAAWIADQEEQAAMNAKMKAEAAVKNDAVAPAEVFVATGGIVTTYTENVAVEDEATIEVVEDKPAPKKRTTRKKK